MCPAIATEYKIIMYKFTLEMVVVLLLIHHRTVFSNACNDDLLLKLTLITLIFLMRHGIVFNFNYLYTILCEKIDTRHARSLDITRLPSAMRSRFWLIVELMLEDVLELIFE